MEGWKDVCTGGRAVANDATAKTKTSRLDGLHFFLTISSVSQERRGRKTY